MNIVDLFSYSGYFTPFCVPALGAGAVCAVVAAIYKMFGGVCDG